MKNLKNYKKPKYKIGDIIVYEDRYIDEISLYQSKIIKSYSYIFDEKSKITWAYHTDQTVEDSEDALYDEDILYKL